MAFFTINSRNGDERQGKLAQPAAEVEETVFAPLVVCEVAEEEARSEVASQAALIRIIRGAVVIELAFYIPVSRIAEILRVSQNPGQAFH